MEQSRVKIDIEDSNFFDKRRQVASSKQTAHSELEGIESLPTEPDSATLIEKFVQE